MQAHASLDEGRIDEAERLMQQVLEHEEIPTVINNLALLRLEHHQQPDEALRLLNKNIENPSWPWQPFTLALAARCCVRLGRLDDARCFLERAVDDFEAGLSALVGVTPRERRAWQEYTSMILEAAGDLGDDRLVWKLYRRWAGYHVLASSHFYGGIAAFNLKRFRPARTAWRRAAVSHRQFLKMYESVAAWCERSLVEPFTMGYDYAGPDSPARLLMYFLSTVHGGGGPFGADRDLFDPVGFRTELAAFLSRPANRMFMLWSTLGPFIDSGISDAGRPAGLVGIKYLIAADGDWGEAWAHKLLMSPAIAPDVKEAAAQGLIQAGRLSRDGSVRMWWQGKVREVPIKAGELRVAEGGGSRV